MPTNSSMLLVRGMGFEPMKAYATGFLLESDLKSSTALIEPPCPFDLNPATTARRY